MEYKEREEGPELAKLPEGAMVKPRHEEPKPAPAKPYVYEAQEILDAQIAEARAAGGEYQGKDPKADAARKGRLAVEK